MVPAEAAGEPHRHQKVKLKDLVRYNLQSVRAYLLKEDFQQLWNYNSTSMGRQVPRPAVSPSDALADRADEESRQNFTLPPLTHGNSSSIIFVRGKSSPAA